MYPFGSLPGNLAAFCRFLRVEHGFRIGPGELHDAARALAIVDLADERTVRHALRTILGKKRDDVAAFDEAFAAFFFPAGGGPRPLERASTRDVTEADAERLGRAAHAPRAAPEDLAAEEGTDAPAGPVAPLAIGDEDAVAPARVARLSYSPLDADAAGETPVLTRVDPEWRDAARALVRRLHLGLSRRWRPAPRGRRFDLRATLRSSLQTGGETLRPRWLRRPPRSPRFVILVDGSRSMSTYARTHLQIAVAMAGASMRVEVFTFSTALQRVTGCVRRAAAGATCRLESVARAWGGGTSIGACLRQFLRAFGERLVGRETVVIIASDGLDVGEPDALREAMRDLHRRSAGVVWLNPLLDTPGYEPTAGGMRAARPYISTFTNVTDANGLAHLARTIRVR